MRSSLVTDKYDLQVLGVNCGGSAEITAMQRSFEGGIKILRKIKA